MKLWPLLLALVYPAAAAHEAVSYGTVSAEFHTDAAEGLRTGDDTLVGYRLTVAGRTMLPAECKCQLLLYPGAPSARVMPQVPELAPGFDDPQTTEGWVKVDAPGTYTLVLAGKPAQPGAFDPFRIEYVLNTLKETP